MLGSWINELPEMINTPFPHVIIDNFLTEEFATSLLEEFPEDSSRFFRYHNPIEKKYATKNFEGLPQTTKLYELFQSDYFLDIIRKLTSIPELEADPHLHGAGLAYHKNGGKLDLHLDYSIHPISKKERRVNIILYLNEKDWKYGGNLELWDDQCTHCVKEVEAKFNTAAIFQTSDLSYHGLPHPIKCPETMRRCSASVYYVSEPRTGVTHRYKAQFFPLPDQPKDERLMKLYDIRVNRTITEEDLKEIFPNWENEGNNYW